MEETRYYRRRGTPDLPMASYLITADTEMRRSAHWHPEPEVVLILRGSVTKWHEKNTVELSQGDIYIIGPNQIHGIHSFSEDARLRRLVFSPEAITMPETHFFQREFVKPLQEGRLEMPRLLQPGHPAYEAIVRQMEALSTCRIYEKDHKSKRLGILMSICTTLMPHCMTVSEEDPVEDPGNKAVRISMRWIHNHYRQKLRLQTLADKVHLHPNYLCALFKAYTGETIFEQLNRIRVESAATLLREEDLPMGQVAELSGFNTESQFYQKFKAIMGITPYAYKKQQEAERINNAP